MNTATSLNLQYAHTLELDFSKINSISVSPNFQEIVIGGSNTRSKTPTTLQVYEIDTGNAVYSLQGHTADINYVAISPDDEKIISASSDSTIRIWSLSKGEEINHFKNTSSLKIPFHSVAIHPNGKTFVAATGNRSLIFSLSKGAIIKSLTASNRHHNTYYALAISPNGKILAAGGGGNCINIWDLETKEEIYIIRGHSSVGRSLCISPDSKTLVSGGDQRIKVWDLETGKVKLSFYGHADLVRSVIITPDGNNLISAGDRFIKIWDLNTGKKLNTIEAHDDAIRALALSSDGEVLASGGVGGQVKIWRIVRE